MITLRNNTGKVLKAGNNIINFVLPIDATISLTYDKFINPLIQNLLNSTPASLVVTDWGDDTGYLPVIRNEGLAATKVDYDSTESHLDADEVQGAIDILAISGGTPSSASVTTTNATPTVLTQITAETGACNLLKCQVMGLNSTGTIKYNSEWTVAFDNTQINDIPVGIVSLHGTTSTMNVAFSVAAGKLVVTVTGLASEIHWKMFYQHYVNEY